MGVMGHVVMVAKTRMLDLSIMRDMPSSSVRTAYGRLMDTT